jgi:hypothetical protein
VTTTLATRDSAQLMERAVIQGDLSQLEPEERVAYYRRVCESLGLNPYTKPFEYLQLDAGGGEKKLVLYARKDCTDQLRDINHVSVTKLEHRRAEGLYIVTAYVVDAEGRTDSAIGAVPIVKEGGQWKTSSNGKRYFEGNGTFIPLTGEALANAIMKAETKAKRRATLSLCGLGMTDESEIDSIPGARAVPMTEVHFDGQTDIQPESTQDGDAARQEAWNAWQRVAMEADELQVPHKELTSDAPIEKVKRWTVALQERVAVDKPVQPPADAEKTAPRDPGTGEVIDDTPP